MHDRDETLNTNILKYTDCKYIDMQIFKNVYF